MQFLQLGFMALLATSSLAVNRADLGQNGGQVAFIEPTVQVTRVWTENDTIELIRAKSVEYAVDPKLMMDIVRCESGNDMSSTTIQSRHYKNGVREKSYGLVQINLPHNPDITYEQAIDPVFAIDFLAHQLAHNRAYLWSCYDMVR